MPRPLCPLHAAGDFPPYPRPGPARRHGVARLPEGAGRFRTHPVEAARRRVPHVARLCRRRRRSGQHLRLPRFGEGGKPGRDRRGDCRERARHRHRLPRPRGRDDPRRPPEGARRDGAAAVRRRRRRGPCRRPAGAVAVHRPRAGQADPAALRLSEDLGGVQPPLSLLHHPQLARRPRQPAGERRRPRGAADGRAGHKGAARRQPGHERLRSRYRPRRVGAGRPVVPRPHHRPCPRARRDRRVGAAALHLPLPARRRADAADGRGVGAAVPRHPVPAREPQRPQGDAAAGERGEGARADRPLA